jgi:hypothetical protein
MYCSRIPYLSQSLDRGYSGWRAQNWASIVPLATNSTQEFRDIQIDRRSCRLGRSTLHFYCSVSFKQHSKFHHIQIHRWTPGLAGPTLRVFTNGDPYELSNTTNGLTGWRAQNWGFLVPCPANSTQSSTIYKLTSGFADYFNFKGLVLM